MRSVSRVPEVQRRRLSNRLASREVELAALQAIANNVNLFTDREVIRHLRDAILAAQAAVQLAELDRAMNVDTVES